MRYFAYGSNMSSPRLKARVPNAERVGVFTLPEHSLRLLTTPPILTQLYCLTHGTYATSCTEREKLTFQPVTWMP